MGVDEKARIGVFICHCGTNIGGVVDVPKVVEYAKTLPNVVYAEANLYTCSSEGISKIKEGIAKYNLNRVIVASCTPRTHGPLFRTACEEAGVNKYLFEMANIRDQCSWAHMHEPEKATEKAKDLVRMAVAKARLLKPLEEPEIDVTPSALVIGGGISGMTAALCLAHQGFKVHIIEKGPELGGMLKHLYRLYPTMEDASEKLNPIANAVKSNKGIDVLTSSVVKQVKGFIGNFEVTVQRGNGENTNLNVGTIIVATGAVDFEPVGMYGYGRYDSVITQLQLEQLLKKGELKRPERVVMIQCVGAREEKGRTYCSRICCMNAIKNALLIKELYPEADVYILFRDLQTYGREYEGYYLDARRGFIEFIKYTPERPPEIVSELGGKLTVRVYDSLLGSDIEIESDLIVLSTPLVPHEEAKELSQVLKVPLGPNGFFFEAHVKLRPIDFATDGIYVCGTAHSPKDTAESVSQAFGVASRAAIPLALKHLRTEAITAVVDENLCSGCGTCVKLCPYGAIEKDDMGIARVTEVVCKGCGVCAASCPERAIAMHHFTDEQVTAQALAALGRTFV
ncbi:MAG: CoB--CoM heterodisulfide reductase iron-sulfur subunit A family protein [Candidatus Bathyarchaeota archaeon]|nr:CoB--CoM heterodisulfide reductase iron-sulfur subunit A family protein [Candidatus Bathyarchaeota archaeon]MDH5595246.1 CoB--CoM heterodisulfide reductase iron-sulfur subunit A family protein [Candidatus Bathyarchaeota archaeon]